MPKIYYELFYEEVPEPTFNKFYEACKTLDWSKCKDLRQEPRRPNEELGALLLDYIYKNHKKIKFFSVDCASFNDTFFLNSVGVQMLPHSKVKIINGNSFPCGVHEDHYKLSEHSKIIKAIQGNIGDDLRGKIWTDQAPLSKAQAILIKQEYDKFQASGLVERGFTFNIQYGLNGVFSVSIQNYYVEVEPQIGLSQEDYPAYGAKEVFHALQFD